jgi:hypothetical protein
MIYNLSIYYVIYEKDKRRLLLSFFCRNLLGDVMAADFVRLLGSLLA